MRKPTSGVNTVGRAGKGRLRRTVVQALVMSRHAAVRQQLVEYLNRSPGLRSSGETFAPEALQCVNPDALVLDLSQVGAHDLEAVLAAARRVGARVIALASIRDGACERAVIEAGGLYRLKTAGADGLAEVVLDLTQSASGAGGGGPGAPEASGVRAATAPG